MSTEQKTRIIDTWQGEQQGDTERATEVVGSADTMPDAFSESAQAALPSTLNAPPASRWPGRLVRLALAAGLGGAVLQWGQWSWAAWQWQPLWGALVGGIGLALAGSGLLAWRDLRRQRHRLSSLEQLRAEMQQAMAEHDQRLAVDWLDRPCSVSTPIHRWPATCARRVRGWTAPTARRKWPGG